MIMLSNSRLYLRPALPRNYRYQHHLAPVRLLSVVTEAATFAKLSAANYGATPAAVEIAKQLLQVDRNLKDAKGASSYIGDVFVKRPEIEAVIERAMTAKASEMNCYHIIYGARGVGKSSLVARAADGKKAVVRLSVESTATIKSLTSSFMKKVTGKTAADLDLDKNDLREALKIFTDVTDITPTVIFDADDGVSANESNKGVLQTVRSLAKEIHDVCNCFIVVSEADAVLQFGKDHRERVVLVDELTFDETKKFLEQTPQAKGLKFTDNELKMIYDNVGGNPIVLGELLFHIQFAPLAKCIGDIVTVARGDLVSFKLQPILKALKEHPEGIVPEYFRHQKYEGVNMSQPKSVAASMKEHNAIIYRMDLKPMVYQMLSTRHKTALKTYDPIIITIHYIN